MWILAKHFKKISRIVPNPIADVPGGKYSLAKIVLYYKKWNSDMKIGLNRNNACVPSVFTSDLTCCNILVLLLYT